MRCQGCGFIIKAPVSQIYQVGDKFYHETCRPRYKLQHKRMLEFFSFENYIRHKAIGASEGWQGKEFFEYKNSGDTCPYPPMIPTLADLGLLPTAPEIS